jgi:hypothetical protein
MRKYSSPFYRPANQHFLVVARRRSIEGVSSFYPTCRSNVPDQRVDCPCEEIHSADLSDLIGNGAEKLRIAFVFGASRSLDMGHPNHKDSAIESAYALILSGKVNLLDEEEYRQHTDEK